MSKLCTICGTEIPEGEDFIVDGQVFCHDCFNDAFVECNCCGEIVPRDEVTQVASGEHVCSDCLETEYTMCECCDEYVPNDEIIVVNRGTRNEKYVCESCVEYHDDTYFRCSDCGDYYTTRYLAMNDGDTYICDGCSDYWYVCSDCGAVIHVDDSYRLDDDDCEVYCESCYSRASRRHGIHDYGFKPLPIFGTTDSRDGRTSYDGDDLTFGVELECDKGDYPYDAAREIAALTDRVYCKHDGSLDNGYEVVTHPGTLAWHMNVFPWRDICDISKAHGFLSHDARTCGLHIHIGRGQLGGCATDRTHTIANMLVLMNTLWPEFMQFSRRNGDDHWCHRNTGLDRLRPGMTEDDAARSMYIASREQGRYVAVNVQNNGTVELRFNRGTLKLSTIFASLQLASNYTLFAKEHSMNECLEAKWDDIVHYREFDELSTYVANRFSCWTDESAFRPTTSFRVGQEAPKADNGFLDRAHKVAMGADLAPEGTPASEGDLVIMVDPYRTSSPDEGPAVGSIGVVVGFNSVGDPGVYWNDTRFEGHNNVSGRTPLENRQWFVPYRSIRIIRTLRNGLNIDRDANLSGLFNYGIIPGDRVTYYNHDADVLFFDSEKSMAISFEGTRFPIGHDAGGMMTDSSGWFIFPSDAERN